MIKYENFSLILGSFIWNFPILQNWGMVPQRSIALIAESRQDLEALVDSICPFALRVQGSDGLPRMRKTMELVDQKNSLAIFSQWQRGDNGNAKAMDKFSLLEEFSINLKAPIPTFVLSDCMLPDPILDRIAILNVPHIETRGQFHIMKLIPEDSDLSTIYKELILEREDEPEYWLVAAARMLLPKLRKNGHEDVAEVLIDAARKLTDEMNSVNSSETIVGEFSEFFLKFARSEFMPEVVKLPQLDMEKCEHFNDYVYSNGQKLYLSDGQFRQIFEKWDFDVSIDALKRVLKDAGILCGYSNGYTVKMPYLTYAGASLRKTMLCVETTRVCSRDGNELLSYAIRKKGGF